MLSIYSWHNLFKESVKNFYENDPQLRALRQLVYQYSPDWWSGLSFDTPGIYILTGGRQVGKSTSCKLLIKHCLEEKIFPPERILYLPCDEIYDAKQLSQVLRFFLDAISDQSFLLVIDEVTYVKDWDRVIKSLADEGYFTRGLCILTGSDTNLLKEAAMRFPGRRGKAAQVDFHLYPLTFFEYVQLRNEKSTTSHEILFQDYLRCGGYLRAINDLAQYGEVLQSTFLTYEQWIRGDFLRQGKSEEYLLALLSGLLTIGVSPISFSSLTQKIGLMSKETCIDYIKLLERMDILIDLLAFDQNKKQGFPKKDRKFHFFDPFIQRTIYQWLQREGLLNELDFEAALVEACVASHCYRFGKVFYFKGQGEVDIIWLAGNNIYPIEVKWSNQIRAHDLKTLKHFPNGLILGKSLQAGSIDSVQLLPVYQFLYQIEKYL